jgi:hypothetical protein
MIHLINFRSPAGTFGIQGQLVRHTYGLTYSLRAYGLLNMKHFANQDSTSTSFFHSPGAGNGHGNKPRHYKQEGRAAAAWRADA